MSIVTKWTPIKKKVIIDGIEFEIRTLTFNEFIELLPLAQNQNIPEFSKKVVEWAVLDPKENLGDLPYPIYAHLVQEIIDFTGFQQAQLLVNPSLRRKQP